MSILASNTTKFLKNNSDYSGTNNAINDRLNNSFNQWTREHNDECSYVNQIRILRKPLKYYVNGVFPPGPTRYNNNANMSYFTSVGNQKQYNVGGNLVFPQIGELTSMKNKRYIEYIQPLNTSPQLGNNAVNTANIDIDSNFTRFGELTNQRDNFKAQTSQVDYNRWDFVDKHVVQNVPNIIFADGVLGPHNGGISTRNELRNFAQLNHC